MTVDPIDRQRISELAFDLWCKRGRPLGSPEVDWRRAEELLAHDSGLYPAFRNVPRIAPCAGNDGRLDGNGFERHASVTASQATDTVPKVFVL